MRKNHLPKYSYWLPVVLLALLSIVCSTPFTASPTVPPANPPTETKTPSPTPTNTVPPTLASSPTEAATATPSPTETYPPTDTPTATETVKPTQTTTPTPEIPQGIVKVAQAFCRYGPGTAYLFSHQLNQGDHVLIDGRNFAGTWLWVKPDNLDRHCWSAASNFDLINDPMLAPVVQHNLPKSTFVNPPTGVEASRDGSQVTIDWDPADYIPVEDRRGYLLELYICQDGVYFWVALQTDEEKITIEDDQNCSQPSSGLLYIAEKHGYSDPVTIPWP